MRVLLSHSDDRPFEVERFGAAWARAGGEPTELLPVTPATAGVSLVLFGEAVAGLLLTGGPDVEPWRFGSTPEEGIELHLDPARDALDIELLGRAEAAGWPVLAVCYGCQLLAVARGGTLIQDLRRAGKPGHSVRTPRDHLAHSVRRDSASRLLAELPLELAVNSRHHQAIASPGERLRVVASAPDGVIEAVEGTERDRFVLGVQWHPEDLAAEPHIGVFRSFRAACLVRSFAAGSPRA